MQLNCLAATFSGAAVSVGPNGQVTVCGKSLVCRIISSYASGSLPDGTSKVLTKLSFFGHIVVSHKSDYQRRRKS